MPKSRLPPPALSEVMEKARELLPSSRAETFRAPPSQDHGFAAAYGGSHGRPELTQGLGGDVRDREFLQEGAPVGSGSTDADDVTIGYTQGGSPSVVEVLKEGGVRGGRTDGVSVQGAGGLNLVGLPGFELGIQGFDDVGQGHPVGQGDVVFRARPRS